MPKSHFEHKPRRFAFIALQKIIGVLTQGDHEWTKLLPVAPKYCAWLCRPCLETLETTAGWPGWGHGGSAQGQPERGPGVERLSRRLFS